MSRRSPMLESLNIPQLVVMTIAVLTLAFGYWKWADAKFDSERDARNKQHQLAMADLANRFIQVRSEALAAAARADAQASRASSGVAELHLEMVRRMGDTVTKVELDRTLDRHFNQFYLRIDTLEKKWERYVDAKVRAS